VSAEMKLRLRQLARKWNRKLCACMRASECRCEFNCDTHTIAHAHRHQRRGHGYSGFSFIQTDRFDCL